MTHSRPIKISAIPSRSGAKKMSSRIPASMIIPGTYIPSERKAKWLD
jgi:hypothetical protein